MIRGSTYNENDILICRSQKDFKFKVYTVEQINQMTINVMTSLSRTRSKKKRELLFKIIEDLRQLKDYTL